MLGMSDTVGSNAAVPLLLCFFGLGAEICSVAEFEVGR